MKKSLATTIAAVALWSAACGVSAESDAAIDTGADAVSVDVSTPEDWETGLDEELGSEGADGSDESGVSEGDGSEDESGVSEGDGTEDSSSDGESTEGPSTPPPGSGGATPGTYVAPDGGVENGYGLRFEVSDDGSVIHSLEADVLESCDGSSTTSTVTVGAGLSWDVVDGSFSARYEEDFDGYSVYTTLEGSFSGTTATGTIRQESVVAGSVCDTYALEFTAELS